MFGGKSLEKTEKTLNSIYSYDLNKKTNISNWIKLKQTLPQNWYEFGCMVSNNDNNLIYFIGVTHHDIDNKAWDYGKRSEIYLLNINNMIYKRCDIMSLGAMEYGLIKPKQTHLLVYGYVNKINIKNIPINIIDIIHNFYDDIDSLLFSFNVGSRSMSLAKITERELLEKMKSI